MIVRDEAALLPRFLEAARGCFDELCVVDTGSVDDTVAILTAAGGTITRRAWDDDFAAARNASLNLATGDVVLVLDPDELPSPEFAPALRAAVADRSSGAWTLTVRNLLHGGHHRDSHLLRAFVRDASIRYAHRIHEDASVSVFAALERGGLRVGHVHPPVEHVGYLRERATEKDKRGRDRRLLARALREDPTDLYSRFKLLEQGRFWADGAALAADAAQTWAWLCGQSGAQAALREAPFGGELLTLVAAGLHAESERARLQFLLDHEALVTPSPAFLLARGELHESLGAPDAAARDYEACRRGRDASGQRTGARPLPGLARLALGRGDLSEAMRRADQALRESPRDPEALLCALALRRTDPASLGRFAGQHVRDGGPTFELAQALVSLGALDAAREVLRLRLPTDPAAALGIVLCELLSGIDSDVEIELTQGQADAALRGWVQTLRTAMEPALLPRLRALAPALAESFPWLEAELRG